ncbi:MAG: zinc ribbon domain-containing protein [Leptolyngbyaceae cyanobacterium RU_5_1]|nr:zinc ribbon domain-containing protein [Leptolyngbyaceae cyanobacterium RU_5_1]
MAYVCELGNGRSIYLDNQGTQTIVTLTSSGPGQQQQASSSVQTGDWNSPPEVYRTSEGAVIKLQTAQGTHYVRVEGSSVRITSEFPASSSSQPLQTQQVASSSAGTMPPMQPMQPMEPMTMGDMQMSMNPMQMRMGNMELRMGSPPSIEKPSVARQFCNQCGASVKPDDRFCSSCGHRLSD